MSDSLKKLQSHAKQKRLFHGSPVAALTWLEPRPASDVDKAQSFNNDTAVFASAEFCLSMIFGIVDAKNMPRDPAITSWSAGGSEEGGLLRITAKIPEQWREHLETGAVGYVYVFSGETFRESDGIQWKSKVAVEPLDCVAVTLRDFYAAGGMVEWIPASASPD